MTRQTIAPMFVALMAIAMTGAADAQQLYKCLVGGRASFQDSPCREGAGERITVTPAASPPGLRGATGAATPQAGGSPADTSRDWMQEADRSARRIILADDIWRQEVRIRAARDELEQRLERLQRKKSYANNNLAGAVWEQSISDEMMAVATAYDTQIRSLQTELEDLRIQLSRLR